jgi:hypothetical protein
MRHQQTERKSARMISRVPDVKPLAVCAIFKNEAPFLLEWLAYHSVIGFDRFILYDNDSIDGGSDLVRSSRFAGRATVIRWPQRPGQLPAYRHFIDCFARDFEWAAFIDLDEFLLPLTGDSIVPLLSTWSEFSAVLVQWRCFGPAGWIERPAGLVIENYDMRLGEDEPVNHTVKSIVKCTDLEGISATPHEFRVRGQVCDTLGRQALNIPNQASACHEILVVNHYITKSKQDWLEKLRRGSPDRDDSIPTYDARVFDDIAQNCDVRDDGIMRFGPKVRALLAANEAPVTEPGSDGPKATGPDQGLSVANRLIRLTPGRFSLSLESGPHADGRQGARVSLPPGPADRPEFVSVNPFRADGWLTADGEPTLIRVADRDAEVLVTLYWPATDGAAAGPMLRLTRLNDGTGTAAGEVAEIVAHIGEIGDVSGRIGQWTGTRGSGRAIEGFSQIPQSAISPEDYEIRAILGRDWLSPWLPGGRFRGSRGLALPMRGFCLRLRPSAAIHHHLRILARFIDGAEVEQEGTDVLCASPGLAPLEAFHVTVLPLGAARGRPG